MSDHVGRLKLLKPKDVAEILGVSRRTLAVWRSEKRYDLPYVKTGARVGYRPEHIEQFIERRTEGAELHDAERSS